MQVSGTLGTLTDDQIAGPFQRRWDDITRCYDDAARRLGYLGGKVEIKLRVDHNGESKEGYIVSSTLGSYQAERCILQIARELQFASPKGGPVAEFSYPIQFRARRPVTEWDAARGAAVLTHHRGEVDACLPKAAPKVALTVYVAPGGKVTSAGLSAGGPLDDGAATCLVQRARSWRFADPLGKIAKLTLEVTS